MWSRDWTPAFRRYQHRLIASLLVYAAALCGAVWLFKHHPPKGLLGYAVAVAPAIPLMGTIASMGFFLKEEGDEFKRAVMVEQILWATSATLAFATVWGFLESFGLAWHMQAYWGACVWFAMFGLARGLVMWRYR